MRYMGSKRRIAKDIYEVMKPYHKGRTWVEPFVGGGNMIIVVEGPRIGGDIHTGAIRALQFTKTLHEDDRRVITEDEYKLLKTQAKKGCITPLAGWVSFNLSFGGKYWSGYARSKRAAERQNETVEENTSRCAFTRCLKAAPLLQGVDLYNLPYHDLPIPPKSLIYCDPPYKGVQGYGMDFDHDKFYEWCLERSREGHHVFISEYYMPEDGFICLWEKPLRVTISKNNNCRYGIEKLFYALF